MDARFCNVALRIVSRCFHRGVVLPECCHPSHTVHFHLSHSVNFHPSHSVHFHPSQPVQSHLSHLVDGFHPSQQVDCFHSGYLKLQRFHSCHHTETRCPGSKTNSLAFRLIHFRHSLLIYFYLVLIQCLVASFLDMAMAPPTFQVVPAIHLFIRQKYISYR